MNAWPVSGSRPRNQESPLGLRYNSRRSDIGASMLSDKHTHGTWGSGEPRQARSNFKLRHYPLYCRAGHSNATNARSAWGRFAPYQVLERNRQRPIARGEFAEQIAVQVIHVRANEDSDPSPVAPDAAVSNHRNDLRSIRIENDVLGKDEI